MVFSFPEQLYQQRTEVRKLLRSWSAWRYRWQDRARDCVKEISNYDIIGEYVL